MAGKKLTLDDVRRAREDPRAGSWRRARALGEADGRGARRGLHRRVPHRARGVLPLQGDRQRARARGRRRAARREIERRDHLGPLAGQRRHAALRDAGRSRRPSRSPTSRSPRCTRRRASSTTRTSSPVPPLTRQRRVRAEPAGARQLPLRDPGQRQGRDGVGAARAPERLRALVRRPHHAREHQERRHQPPGHGPRPAAVRRGAWSATSASRSRWCWPTSEQEAIRIADYVTDALRGVSQLGQEAVDRPPGASRSSVSFDAIETKQHLPGRAEGRALRVAHLADHAARQPVRLDDDEGAARPRRSCAARRRRQRAVPRRRDLAGQRRPGALLHGAAGVRRHPGRRGPHQHAAVDAEPDGDAPDRRRWRSALQYHQVEVEVAAGRRRRSAARPSRRDSSSARPRSRRRPPSGRCASPCRATRTRR